MKISELIREKAWHSLNSWSDNRAIRVFLEKQPETRLARKMIAKGVLKAFGEYDEAKHKILNVDGKLYAMEKALTYRLQIPAKVNKMEEYKANRRLRAEHNLKNFFPLRYVKSVSLADGTLGTIESRDEGNRKYGRSTYAVLPTNVNQFQQYTTTDFFVCKKQKDEELIDDLHVCQVWGWWKQDIRGNRVHYPTSAWLAYNEYGRTITRSRNTAITGLKVRITNKVMKSIAA